MTLPPLARVLTMTLVAAAALLAAPAAAQQGGYGFGGYYGGYYDPTDPERSYPDPAVTPKEYVEGKLSLRIKPKQALVFIDGRHTGIVDDFDDASRPVRIEAGTHRIEVKQPGFKTLTFSVRIQPQQTTTYRGGLKKLPPGS